MTPAFKSPREHSSVLAPPIPRFALAGAEGLEPTTLGFGDRCATNCATPLSKRLTTYNIQQKTAFLNERRFVRPLPYTYPLY